MSAHIADEQALFLVSLDEDDPEKRAALSHAAECEACAKLLRESEAMLRMLDAEASIEPISMQLEARVHAAVFAPARPTWIARVEVFAWWALATLSGVLIWHDGQPDRPLEPMVGMHCMRFELLFAAAAFTTGVVIARLRGTRSLGALRGSVLAMSGALLGQVLLRTRCEAPDAALHLLVFNGLGVLLASALGSVAGRWLSRPSPGRPVT